MSNYLSPEGHESTLDCARWACVAAGPMLMTAGTPHAVMTDSERDEMLLLAGWTLADLLRALISFVADRL
jgi:hypothetical protein